MYEQELKLLQFLIEELLGFYCNNEDELVQYDYNISKHYIILYYGTQEIGKLEKYKAIERGLL
jgi:hypothetical protein